ncbi:MAG: aminoglycoside phosphotransferase [Betaproteobacteria bacterium]|nr:aminoglycoside phosphotransferase [Betaproteobacteria bacterium]NBT11568.1 aminoglycoside phosphotransferase [Betaproteobacteria bacterium]NBU50689.1 aminoglycoside phosphotransferase [Betaproteobacteria bacterium]
MSAPPSYAPAVHWPDPERRAAFDRWLGSLVAAFDLRPATLCSASADASFRRYLRLHQGPAGSVIVMDAPPPLEDVRPFVRLARQMHAAGLHAPQVLAADEEQGFVLLSDLGQELLLPVLQQAQAEEGPSSARADALMRSVGQSLVQWQTAMDPSGWPAFDEALLRREMALFPQWCAGREFGQDWNAAERQAWDRVTQRLVDSALAQPTVAVHRDWMPRNLMVCGPRLGILDFQDAVRGPVTYDAASMLRDAFISWDEEREIDWAVRYWQQARAAGLPVQEDFGEFWRALEWMGLQRHLKVLGIFCRLKHRDGKAQYAQDLPRFFAYATKVALRYRELAPLLPLIEPLSGFALEQGYTLR